MKQLCIPAPSEKQWQFLTARERYVAFGGARGGGKSWAVRVKALLLCLQYGGIRVMIVRRTYPELRSNHIEPLRALVPGELGTYNDSRKELRFVNGSLILFRYCDGVKDMERYQGTEADVIFMDEATQFDEQIFRMFAACLRGVNGFPKRLYLTCNPGGRGHEWVKRLFIDRRFRPGEDPGDYRFIRSLVTDNKALMGSQKEYIRQLEALPNKLRAAWLEGRWDILEGKFFSEFRPEPSAEGNGLFTHVIPAFTPPRSWRRFRSFDFGYAKPFSCGWWAMDGDGRLYRILEYYGCADPEGSPDTGLRMEAGALFREIRRIEETHPYLQGHHITGVADPAIWQQSGGPSIADMAAAAGVYFERGDHKRVPGWMQMRYRLAFREDGRPMLYVFDSCSAFIRTCPLMIHSGDNPEDLDTATEDHVMDESRYMCMMNPLPPVQRAPAGERGASTEDPLELKEQKDYTLLPL